MHLIGLQASPSYSQLSSHCLQLSYPFIAWLLHSKQIPSLEHLLQFGINLLQDKHFLAPLKEKVFSSHSLQELEPIISE